MVFPLTRRPNCLIFAPLLKFYHSSKELVWHISKLAFPITIGQLVLVLMGFADVVMLGNYKTIDMSAAGFGNAIFFLFMLLGVGTMYAVSTITSIADGEDRPQQTIPIFFSSIRVSTVLIILMMGVNTWLY